MYNYNTVSREASHSNRSCLDAMQVFNNKQLLDEAEHDIKNYSDRGQCYLPKRS